MTRIWFFLLTAIFLVTTTLPVTATRSALAATSISHTVVRGDTLYSLARRYGTTVDAIKQENNISGTVIYIGQSLWIPSSPVQPVHGTVYTVVRYDTLYSIARRYGTTVDAIMAANNLWGTLIYIGQLLNIPNTNMPLPPTAIIPTATPTFTPTPTPTIPVGAPCPCAADTLNCSNFTTGPQAQACMDYCISQGRGDIHNLDGDPDGDACEDLPEGFTVVQ